MHGYWNHSDIMSYFTATHMLCTSTPISSMKSVGRKQKFMLRIACGFNYCKEILQGFVCTFIKLGDFNNSNYTTK